MSGLLNNTAGQNLPLGTFLLTDGTPVTSGVTLKWSKDGAATAASAGTLTHVGEGAWNYVPTQAETNCTVYQATLTATGGVNRSVGGFTITASTAPTASDIVTAIFAHTILTVTVEKWFQRIGAVLAGKITGARTATEKFYDPDGTTERVRMAPDSSGNRTVTFPNG